MFTRSRPRLIAGTLTALALAGGLAACGSDDTQPNSNAMDHSSMGSNMGNGSDTNPTADAAFVREMIPHHQMAVQMGRIAQDQATHREVKDLADAIISTQTTEIDQMEKIADRLDISLGHGGDQMRRDADALGLDVDEMGMSMQMHDLSGADPFDREFIDEMIPHHEGAIAMAKAVIAKGDDAEIKRLAEGIITAQEKEVAEMKQWRKAWYGASPGSEDSDSGHDMGDMMGN